MGKTSIIEVLITEKFSETVQPVLPVLVVPRDVTPENVHVSIVDTPGDPSQVMRVDTELNQADVVVLVYAVDDEISTGRVLSHWLPKFRSMDMKVPVVLIGNKIDTRGGVQDPSAAAKMEAFIKPIMDRFREVDVCIECSAKTLSNISEVFYFAQKAVLYPTGPVYDVETHQLKPKAVAALRRIFKMCDRDADGGLNDIELNDFQNACFNVRLQPQELEGVKRVVKENNPTQGLRPDGSLSVSGFIFLHTLFVQKGRLETTWIVLRKFNYDDELRLRVDQRLMPKVGIDQSVELSDVGKEFLRNVFHDADKDSDGLISAEELSGIFVDCADGPFAEVKLKNADIRMVRTYNVHGKGDYYNFKSFISRWDMLLSDSVEEAMRCLMYLGFGNDDLPTAIKVTKSRRRDRASRTISRDVIHIGVFGSDGSMNTDVVRGLVKCEPRWLDEQGCLSAMAISDGETEKTLLMRYVGPQEEQEILFGDGSLEKLDMMCIVFDVASQESFAKGLEVWQALQERKAAAMAAKEAGTTGEGTPSDVRMPVVFVGAFGENATDDNRVLALADDFCLEQSLPTPTRVSVSDGDFGKLYDDLLGVAMYPQVACPDYYVDADGGESAISAVIKVTVGATVLGVVAYAGKKFYDYYFAKPGSSSS